MTGGGMDWDTLAIDGQGHLRDLAAAPTYRPPADITWTAAAEWPILWGEFVCVARDDGGHDINLRAVSEVFEDVGGRWVLVVDHLAFCRWEAARGDRPAVPRPARAVALQRVFVSHPKVHS